MHQTLSRRLFTTLLTILLLITCAGCEKETKYSIAEWYRDLASTANLTSSTNQEEIINTLIAWKIIESPNQFTLNDSLTYEVMAYTLAHLVAEEVEHTNTYIIDETNYTKEINNVLDLGLYENEDLHFESQSDVPLEIAQNVLEKAIYHINHREFPERFEIEFDESVQKLADNYVLEDLEVGQVYADENNRVYDVEIDEQGVKYLKEVDPLPYLKDMELSSDEELTFEDAYFEDLYPNGDYSSIYEDERFERKAFKFIDSHHFEIDDFNISYYFNFNSVHIHVSKTTDRGLNLYFDGNINHIKPSYKWKYGNHKLEEAYFKMAFDTNESLGLSTARYHNLYGNFKDAKSLKDLFKNSEDIVEKEMTLFKIHVPIEGLPTAEIVLVVKLNLYLSGCIELALSSENDWGFEIRNGQFRTINNNETDLDLVIGASASSSLGIETDLKALEYSLMNIAARAGIRGQVKTTFHVYDSKGYLKTYHSDAEYDLLDEIAKDVGEPVYVCGDISLNWLFDLEFNTQRSLAGRFGFNKVIHILDQDNQVFKNLTHIENGVFKDHCSYLDREHLEENHHDEIIVSDKLILANHAIVLKERHQIKIVGMPANYSLSDIKYMSEDETIATVTSTGLIKRVSPGVTRIKVTTKDNNYEVFLNVMVSDLDA